MTKPPEPVVTGELKPCPFCGGPAQIQLDHGRNTIGVGCTKCTCCLVPSWGGDDAEYWAVKTWNTRTAHSLPGDVGTGWVVGNSSGTKWRCWGSVGPDWTDDRDKATRYARRIDAERVHAEDDDAWRVEPFATLAPSSPRLREVLEDIKGYAFHIPGCAHFRLENGPHGLRHSVCDCGFVETSNAAAALTPSALPECPHEAWEDRGGANCCVDCGIWFEDATPSALSGDAGEERVWPTALTQGLREILGIPNFQCGPMAHAYQKIGEFSGSDGLVLEKRAEDEQAFILHKLVGFWFEHGDGWREPAIDEIDRAAKLARAASHQGAGDE